MDRIEGAIEKATAAYANGQHEVAYSQYLKAVYSIMTFLSQATHFERSLNADMLQLARQCLDRATEVLPDIEISESDQSKIIERAVADTNERKPIEKGTPKETRAKKRRVPRKLVPLLPVSPLSADLASFTSLNRASNSRAEEVRNSKDELGSKYLTTLRRLLDDEKMYATRIDQTRRAISLVETHESLLDFDPALVAKQLTVIQCRLVEAACDPAALVQSALKEPRFSLELWRHPYVFMNGRSIHPHVAACLDFNHYLGNFVTRCVLESFMRPPPQQSKGFDRLDVVYRLLEIAHMLLYKYRNFESLSAIVLGLNAPQLVPLDILKQLSSKERKFWELLAQLFLNHTAMRDPRDSYVKYFERLKGTCDEALKTSLLLAAAPDPGTTVIERQAVEMNQVLAIPWLLPFLDEVRHCFDQFGTKQLDLAGTSIVSTVVNRERQVGLTSIIGTLSDPGRLRIHAAFDMLKKCFHKIIRFGSTNTGPMTIELKQELEKVPKDYINDLKAALPGDRGMEHWILTRLYINTSQLWDLSASLNPVQRPTEEPPLDEYETEEEDIPSDSDEKPPAYTTDTEDNDLLHESFDDLYDKIMK